MDYTLIGLVVSVVINLTLLIGIRNLLKQNEQLEDRLIGTIKDTQSKVLTALEKMQEIDTRQAFEKDDEVGVTFDQLKKIVEDLNEQI
jgi:competence protein ComGC